MYQAETEYNICDGRGSTKNSKYGSISEVERMLTDEATKFQESGGIYISKCVIIKII